MFFRILIHFFINQNSKLRPEYKNRILSMYLLRSAHFSKVNLLIDVISILWSTVRPRIVFARGVLEKIKKKHENVLCPKNHNAFLC